MNMDLLFGMSAFDQTHDVCKILESVAPNVSELQLFRDDAPDLCMRRECLLSSFRFCFTSPHLGASILFLPTFTFSPFVTPLSVCPSSATNSLFALPVPWTWQRWEWVVCLYFFGLPSVIPLRLSLFGPLVFRPADSRFCFAYGVPRSQSAATTEVSESQVGDHVRSGAIVVRSDLRDRCMVCKGQEVARGDCRHRLS